MYIVELGRKTRHYHKNMYIITYRPFSLGMYNLSENHWCKHFTAVAIWNNLYILVLFWMQWLCPKKILETPGENTKGQLHRKEPKRWLPWRSDQCLGSKIWLPYHPTWVIMHLIPMKTTCCLSFYNPWIFCSLWFYEVMGGGESAVRKPPVHRLTGLIHMSSL